MHVLPIREYNPNHEPKGSPKGGQFAKAPAQSTGEPYQPPLVDVKTGEPKFDPEKKGLKIERPGGAKKSSKTASQVSHLRSFNEEDGVAEALGALGVSVSARTIAEAMVSEVTGETFSVHVSATDSDGGPLRRNDGPDPSDVRDTYDEWVSERVSEQESDLHREDRGDYLDASEASYSVIHGRVNELLGDRVVGGGDATEIAAREAWADPELRDHSLALAEKIYDTDLELVDTDGRLRGRSIREGTGLNDDAKLQQVVQDYLKENPDAKFAPFPGNYLGEPGGEHFDRKFRAEHSKFFNSNDGLDNWIDDDQSSRIDVPSFDDWYEREYGHSPDDYGEGSFDDANVEFTFSGSKGSSITRSFSMKDGELHVHHDYFKAGTTGEGLSKQLYQGSLPMYDRMGVRSISTQANIDTGAYAWARYGFTADNPRSMAQHWKGEGERLFKDTGLFDAADWDNFTALLGDGTDGTIAWDLADARYYTTPERAMALAKEWERPPSRYGHMHNEPARAVFNKMLHDDAAKGVVNVGRLAMLAAGRDGIDVEGWSATLDLQDEDSVKRLEGYVGPWRDRHVRYPATPEERREWLQRNGVSAADAAHVTSGKPPKQQIAAGVPRRDLDDARRIYKKAGKFNQQLARYNAAASPERQIRGDDANILWGHVQRGVPFERAVQDKQRARQSARSAERVYKGTMANWEGSPRGRKLAAQLTPPQRKRLRSLMVDKGLTFYTALLDAAPKVYGQLRRQIIGV